MAGLVDTSYQPKFPTPEQRAQLAQQWQQHRQTENSGLSEITIGNAEGKIAKRVDTIRTGLIDQLAQRYHAVHTLGEARGDDEQYAVAQKANRASSAALEHYLKEQMALLTDATGSYESAHPILRKLIKYTVGDVQQMVHHMFFINPGVIPRPSPSAGDIPNRH